MRRGQATTLTAAAVLAVTLAGCAVAVSGNKRVTPDERLTVLRRSQIWTKTDVPSMDMTRGPDGGFPSGAEIECDYRDVKYGGSSPKFGCELSGKDERKKDERKEEKPSTAAEKKDDAKEAKKDTQGEKANKDAEKDAQGVKSDKDVVKVRYGDDNGEVYAGAATTRLLWALGFGADALYPVHVICRHCPPTIDGQDLKDGRMRFEVAAIERPYAGHKIEAEGEDDGWPWKDLDLLQPGVGGQWRQMTWTG
jgi:hypothetical protein